MGIKTLSRKRVSNILLWGVAAALVVNLGWRVYKVSLKVRAASTGYTVIRTEKAFDKAGNLRYTNEYVDAVLDDASVVARVATPIEPQRRSALVAGCGV